MYYMNLQRRADRRAEFETMARSVGVSAVRFPALDGQTVPLTPSVLRDFRHADFLGACSYQQGALPKKGERPCSYCTWSWSMPECLGGGAARCCQWKASNKALAADNAQGARAIKALDAKRRGMLGVCLSFYALYKHIAASSMHALQSAIVCEDDLVLVPDFRARLEAILHRLRAAKPPLMWDVLVLGAPPSTTKRLDHVGRKVADGVHEFVNATAAGRAVGFFPMRSFAVTKAGAVKLQQIVEAEGFSSAHDVWLMDYANGAKRVRSSTASADVDTELRTYVVYPHLAQICEKGNTNAICRQHTNLSTSDQRLSSDVTFIG